MARKLLKLQELQELLAGMAGRGPTWAMKNKATVTEKKKILGDMTKSEFSHMCSKW